MRFLVGYLLQLLADLDLWFILCGVEVFGCEVVCLSSRIKKLQVGCGVW